MPHRAIRPLAWLAATIVGTYACQRAAFGSTPIDHALPFVAALISLLAWMCDDERMLAAVPLLLTIEVAVADEWTRLLLLGVITACALAWAAYRAQGRVWQSVAVALAATLLLRWIPLTNITVWRELILISAIFWIVLLNTPRTPAAILAAAVFALTTPPQPLRMLLVPFVVLVACLVRGRIPLAIVFAIAALLVHPALAPMCVAAALLLVAPYLRAPFASMPAVVAASLAIALFAWSGVVARGPLWFALHEPAHERQHVWIALSRGQSTTLEVPQGATQLILSAANATTLRRGAILGRVGATAVRIGDLADWGWMRREHSFNARNPVPRHPAGELHEYGQLAWADGAGAIAVPRGAKSLTVTASPSLPEETRLQIDAFELERR